MLIIKQYLEQALDNMGSNYRKVLLVNLTDDSFNVGALADDELPIVNEKHFKSMSEYWEWFCNSGLVHNDDVEACRNYRMDAGSHLVYRRKIGNEWRRVLLELIPAHDYSETHKVCVLYVRDIENIYKPEYEQLVESLGTVDNMTKLRNKLGYEKDREKHKGEKAGIIFADLNGLKWTNDKKGHRAGDELILKFAGLLSVNFGDYSCYHISGDEFVVCAYNKPLHEFVSRALAFHKSLWIANDIPIAAMGYSVAEAGQFDMAYTEAEREMYDDKRIFYMRFPEFKR